MLTRFMSPSTRIIGGTPADRCRSEALFLTANASSWAISRAMRAPKDLPGQYSRAVSTPPMLSGPQNSPPMTHSRAALRRSRLRIACRRSGGGPRCATPSRFWPSRRGRPPPQPACRSGPGAEPTSARTTCRRPCPRSRRCATWRQSGTSSASCRPTRPAPWRSISPGCTAWTGCKIAERLSAQRPHLRPATECLRAGERSWTKLPRAASHRRKRLALLAQVAALPRLRLRGLMCMLPYGATPRAAAARDSRRLRELLRRSAGATGLELDTLSMGMSADLEQAIAGRRHAGAHRHGAVRRARLSQSPRRMRQCSTPYRR